MTIDRTAFEQYRQSPTARTTLPRLALGVIVIVFFWAAATLAVLVAGSYISAEWQASARRAAPPLALQDFVASPAGVLTALASFVGIWIGTWVAMRWIHREPLGALIGNSRRIDWPAFAKGLVAVLLTSLFSEILLYWLQPEMKRGTIGLLHWLLFVIPIAALTFVQTSAEELLFRGYLPRGLAKRFRSPLVWGLLPTLLFVSLHWSPSSTFAINACIMATIGAFALLLMLLVYATGNLGAAFGAHLGNNLTGFLLISHQENYNAFALFTARPLEAAGWTALDAVLIAGIGIVSSLLTALLLLHPHSPLKVEPDRSRTGETGAAGLAMAGQDS